MQRKFLIALLSGFFGIHAPSVVAFDIVPEASSLGAAIAPFTESKAAHRAKTGKAKQIPLEYFAQLPNLDGAKLSPNGSKIAYLISQEGRQHLYVQELSNNKTIAVPPLNNTEIDTFYWANADTILLLLSTESSRFRGSRAVRETKLLTFNIKTHERIWLAKPDIHKTKSGVGQRPSQHEKIIDLLPDEPDFILLELDFELDTRVALYKVNVRTGKRSLVQYDRWGIQNWYTDQSHQVRFGYGYTRKGKREAVFKDHAGKWIDVKDLDWSRKYSFHAFTERNDVAYVSGITEHGTAGIFTLDLISGEILETIFARKHVDFDDLVQHPVTRQIVGVSYHEKGLKKHQYFSKELATIQQSLEVKIPEVKIQIASKAKDKPLYLIAARNSQIPGLYFLYDAENKTLTYLDSSKPGIAAKDMAAVKPVNIAARDGTPLPSILTIPQNYNRGDRFPSVILPHGGPQGKDTAHWDEWAQFLANRGYIVLQPNFRGSSGFGYAFEHAGKNQWGGLMQDDLTDATKWLISEGYADPDKVCVMGASYGGYAALMGVIKEPGLYKCAIAINGVVNLPGLKKTDRIRTIGGSNWTKSMGLEGVEDKGVSPYHRFEEINVPVLLIAAKDDTRISYKQSRNMHRKLKKQHLSTYVQIEDGGHYLNTEKSHVVILTEVEKFLAKHIGG
ncbi:MAG: hypothetical protein COB37_05265 [Kordiimonadales bacterium]|nr:MAG: hypothetical protein COB37_05265 [Kordiimonadales bacterium]